MRNELKRRRKKLAKLRRKERARILDIFRSDGIKPDREDHKTIKQMVNEKYPIPAGLYNNPQKSGTSWYEAEEERKKAIREENCSYFEERAKALLSVGYSSYPAYLRSDLWASIRRSILDRDGHRCRVCKITKKRGPKEAKAVHHLSYSVDVLLGHNYDELASICHGCHQEIKFTGNGNRRSAKRTGEVCRGRMKTQDRVRKKKGW